MSGITQLGLFIEVLDVKNGENAGFQVTGI